MKKLLAILLSAVCAVAVMVGCDAYRPGNDDDKWYEQVDPSKTQLYVSNLKGGIGHDWLYNVKQRFEAAYADHVFEEGKKGIQVMVDTDNSVNGAWLILPTSEWEVYFSENVPFNDYISQGQLLDISDVVKAPAYGETETIESKLDDSQKTAFTAMNGNYYVLPHYEAYRGLSYNVTVFEDNKLFLADDKDNGNEGFIMRLTDKRSAGPNGKYGDYDDGLPATVEEFFKLCDRMAMVGVTPIVWPGAYVGYAEYIVDAFAQAFMGADACRYDLTFDSGNDTVEIITGFNGDTPITQQISVTNENGYLLRQQSGKYFGYAVLQNIIKNIDKYVYSLSNNNSTFTHYDSQEEFLVGEFENKPIGMIADGNYWWNETSVSGAYQRSVNQFADRAKAENRNFSWMSLPGVWSAEDGETPATELVLRDVMKSYCFVNGNIADKPAKVAAAKAFVSFCYTDESLQEFTTTTGVAKGLDYELTSEQLASLTKFGQSCWTMRQEGTVVRSISGNQMFMENEQEFTAYLHRSTVSGQSYQTPFTAFKAGVSAKDYFMGNWIAQSDWNRDYSKYFAV